MLLEDSVNMRLNLAVDLHLNDIAFADLVVQGPGGEVHVIATSSSAHLHTIERWHVNNDLDYFDILNAFVDDVDGLLDQTNSVTLKIDFVSGAFSHIVWKLQMNNDDASSVTVDGQL